MYENHTPNVLKQPFVILIPSIDLGMMGSVFLMLPIGINSVFCLLILRPEYVENFSKVFIEIAIEFMSLMKRVHHLVKANGDLYSVEEARECIPHRSFDYLGFYSIIKAIPSKWKHILHQCKSSVTDLKKSIQNETTTFQVKQNNILKSIDKIRTNNFYWELTNRKTQPPTAIEIWTNLYPFLENADWKSIYKLPYLCTREPHLQSFQYKILNRIINTNHNLHKWKIKESPYCNHCQESYDTIEHHFYYCNINRDFWSKLSKWFKNNYETAIELTVCEILLGIPITNKFDFIIQNLNFIIINAKWYINRQRSSENPINFQNFLNILRDKVNTYKHLYYMECNNEEFERKFWDLYSALAS